MDSSRHHGDSTAHSSRKPTQDKLDPWKGHKIPEVPVNISHTSKIRDFAARQFSDDPPRPHRPQRVNDEIKEFNKSLALITENQGLVLMGRATLSGGRKS